MSVKFSEPLENLVRQPTAFTQGKHFLSPEKIKICPVRSNPDPSRDADAPVHRTSNGVHSTPTESIIQSHYKNYYSLGISEEELLELALEGETCEKK